MIDFQRPVMLVFALLAPLYWWLRLRWHKDDEKRLRRFVRPVLWERVGIHPPSGHKASRLLLSLATVLFAAALAGPVWGTADAFIPSVGANVVVALDVSRSMLCDDESPNRLGRAAAEIQKLVESMPGTRFSLVLFSGHSRLAVPITLDAEYIVSRIPKSSRDDLALPEGTNLSNLVDVMVTALPNMELEGRVGIIFSDGGFHDHSVPRAVSNARSGGLALVTVGMGGDTPVTVPGNTGPLVWQGDTVRTVLEEGSLMELARGTGGFYTRIAEAGDLSTPVEEMLRRSTDTVEEQLAGSTGARRYQYFLGAGLILAMLALFLERRES